VAREQREQPGDFDAPAHLAVVVPAAEVHRSPFGGLAQSLEGGELQRLVLRHSPSDPVAHHDLHWGGERRDRQRNHKRGAHVAGALAVQPAPGVGGGDQQPGDDVAGEIHVRELGPEVGVAKQSAPRLDVDHLPAA
jgi:hypothetical protein